MQIQIPIQLQRVMQELPPLELFNESPPMPPPPPPQPVNLLNGAIAIVGVMFIIGVIGNFVSPYLTFILLILGLGIVLWRLQLQYLTYKIRLKDHSAITENYFLLLTSYSQKQSAYEQKIAAARSPERLSAYRAIKIQEVLSRTNGAIAQKALPHGDIVPNSVWQQQLGQKIHIGLTIPIPGFNHNFIPAYTYIDPQTNLHLAIALNQELQQICTDFLLKAGWLVAYCQPEEILSVPPEIIELIKTLTDPT